MFLKVPRLLQSNKVGEDRPIYIYIYIYIYIHTHYYYYYYYYYYYTICTYTHSYIIFIVIIIIINIYIYILHIQPAAPLQVYTVSTLVEQTTPALGRRLAGLGQTRHPSWSSAIEIARQAEGSTEPDRSCWIHHASGKPRHSTQRRQVIAARRTGV